MSLYKVLSLIPYYLKMLPNLRNKILKTIEEIQYS